MKCQLSLWFTLNPIIWKTTFFRHLVKNSTFLLMQLPKQWKLILEFLCRQLYIYNYSLQTVLLRKTMSVDSWASAPPFQYNFLTSSDVSEQLRTNRYNPLSITLHVLLLVAPSYCFISNFLCCRLGQVSSWKFVFSFCILKYYCVFYFVIVFCPESLCFAPQGHCTIQINVVTQEKEKRQAY